MKHLCASTRICDSNFSSAHLWALYRATPAVRTCAARAGGGRRRLWPASRHRSCCSRPISASRPLRTGGWGGERPGPAPEPEPSAAGPERGDTGSVCDDTDVRGESAEVEAETAQRHWMVTGQRCQTDRWQQLEEDRNNTVSLANNRDKLQGREAASVQQVQDDVHCIVARPNHPANTSHYLYFCSVTITDFLFLHFPHPFFLLHLFHETPALAGLLHLKYFPIFLWKWWKNEISSSPVWYGCQ